MHRGVAQRRAQVRAGARPGGGYRGGSGYDQTRDLRDRDSSSFGYGADRDTALTDRDAGTLLITGIDQREILRLEAKIAADERSRTSRCVELRIDESRSATGDHATHLTIQPPIARSLAVARACRLDGCDVEALAGPGVHISFVSPSTMTSTSSCGLVPAVSGVEPASRSVL